MRHSENDPRNHISPDILRVVDSSKLPITEMVVGQTLHLQAIDAATELIDTFGLQVLSVRATGAEGPAQAEATYQLITQGFSFYDSSDLATAVQLPPGTLLETGVAATLLPQRNMTMVYMGGIEAGGRDQEFEYVDGEDRSVIARGVQRILIEAAPAGYQPPDLSEYFSRLEEKQRQREEAEAKRERDIPALIMADMDEIFADHPDLDRLKATVSDYSANGMIVLESFFRYAREDGVLDAAVAAFTRADNDTFGYDDPAIRGDVDFKESTRRAFMGMMQEAEVQWPRPPRDSDTE
jgi:hypothetical protein